MVLLVALGAAATLAACRMPAAPPAGPGSSPDTSPGEETAGEATEPETVPGGNTARVLVVDPRALLVGEGSFGRYTLTLGAQPSGAVTVTATASSAELTAAPAELVFTAGDWRTPRPVTVRAGHDADTAPDVPARITHTAAGGGYDGVSATATVTIVEDDVSSLAIADVRAGEQAGRMRFEVTLSRASDAEVTVHYGAGTPSVPGAPAGTAAPADTATAGEDFIATSGMLRYPPGSTTPQTIEVAVLDDRVDEPEEHFTVTLSNPAHAVLAGGGPATAATGSIEDDDQRGVLVDAPALTVPQGGSGDYAAVLTSQPTAAVTIAIDVPQEGPVSTDPARLTFDATNWRTAQTVAVAAAASATVAATYAITHRAAGGDYAGQAVPAVTVTISGPDTALELSRLEVTGTGTAMEPAFSGAIRHYRMRCNGRETLHVEATSLRSGAQLTLLRDNEANNVSAHGSLTAQVTVEDDHDVAIELKDGGETATYVVHCIPQEAHDIHVLANTDGETGGLLFVRADTSIVVDYNGVTRLRLGVGGRNFRHHADGPEIAGRRVVYSLINAQGARLMDADFDEIRTVTLPARLPMDVHDFILEDDRYLFIAYVPATRDFTAWGGADADPVDVEDSVIVEMLFDGTIVKEWNSWDYLKIAPDCEVLRFPGEYAHLNSLQLVDDDVIASFRGCAQVVRIDRSSGSWALEWKLGGTARDGTEFLEIVTDELAEFCGQHHATLYTPVGKTGVQHVVLFDNGVYCLGARKAEDQITRVVEYDISSATQAAFVREYRRNENHGISRALGGVTVLENGNWLIAWGGSVGYEGDGTEVATITEVDTGGKVVFEMNVSSSGSPVSSYRVYHAAEDSITLPLNLP